jgi:hypothetical protein
MFGSIMPPDSSHVDDHVNNKKREEHGGEKGEECFAL